MPDATAGETVRAVVVREHSTLTSDELREWSRQKLAAYKVPRQVMFVSEVPKSPIGKILRKDVRAAQHTAPPGANMIGPYEQAMLTSILFLVMLGMGAAITFRDIGAQLRRPGVLILAGAGQFLIMPPTAFLLALALALPTSAIGLVLMGCMPGGTTSNLYTYFAKANLSLSVIVTVMTTLAAILLTPLLLLVYGGALAGDIEIPLGNVVVSLILLILPVVIGMAMRRWTANVDGALEVLGSVLGMVFILLLLVTWVPGNWPLLIATPWQVYVGAIALP